MRSLPISVRVYILGIMLVGAVTLAISLPALTRASSTQIVLALAAMLMIVLATIYRIPISDDKAVTVTVGLSFAAILLVGVALATWATATGVLIASAYLSFYRKRWKWYTGVFNTAVYSLSVALAALTYQRIGPMEPGLVSWLAIVSVSIAGGVYFAANSILVAGIVALRKNLPAWSCWVNIAQEIAAEYFALVFLGIIIAAAYQHAPWTLPLLIIPLIILYYSLKKHQAPSQSSLKEV